jgi:hypothetical protein
VTVHLVAFEHADHGLRRAAAYSDERAALACFTVWAAAERADGEDGRTTPPGPDEPACSVEVWRGDFGSRIFRLALEVQQ